MVGEKTKHIDLNEVPLREGPLAIGNRKTTVYVDI
jgi:hypothetical protein